jgi:hypothetical protein
MADLLPGPEKKPRNYLADALMGVGLPTLAQRANDPTSGIGIVADGIGGVAQMLMQPVESFQTMLANPYQRGGTDDRFVENAFDVAGGAMTGGLLAPRPRASVGMGGREKGPRPEPQPAGIRAYHGSPHEFDKFDMSKIGTGEGAQAFGHGLYFAENEGVAKSYRDALGTAPWRTLDGAGGDWAKVARSDIEYYNGNVDAAVSSWRDLATRKPDSVGGKASIEKLAAYERGEVDALNPGRLYEVRINANPEDFLDWDKPLSQQSEKVRGAVDSMARNAENYDKFDNLAIAAVRKEHPRDRSYTPTGEEFMRDYGGLRDPSAELRKAGIPGIRYLDQGSRGAGEGSRNYVVFDDSLIEILRKYGLAGLLGAGGAVNSLMSTYGYDAQGQAQLPSNRTRNIRPGDI